MSNSHKVLYLLGGIVYAFTPLPVAATLVGDRMMRNKGRRMWREQYLQSRKEIMR